MTEQGRILNIKARSVGLLGPPRKNYFVPQPKNHKGLGVLSASTHGNLPSKWSCSQQSPPQALEMQRGKWEWTT
mgnify:CR=1 FL=1|tara:strand:- start:4012 stop:4233 length:222 start_codon:yes stop_codon:yes gene_type:complete